MFNFLQTKKTNFVGGGLRLYKHSPKFKIQMRAAENFVAPRKRDNRDLCVQTSDQSDMPKCAAYTMAGFIEVRNWRIKHFPEQVDPFPIYATAKKIDGDFNDGTSLDSVGQAALELQLITGEMNFIDGHSKADIQYAIHQYDVVVGGFSITDEWNSVNSKTGRIATFSEDKAQPIGGHAVLICGYDEEGVYIQNSWGPFWGLYGFGLLPWEQFEMQFSYGLVIK